MPIYEFYCANCNKILSFFSRKVNTTALPDCPHCGYALSREVSHIAIVSGNNYSDALGDAPFDESKMENAVEKFGNQIETMGDCEDPRKAAVLMRQFAETSGIKFNDDISDAIGRMEKGEDPDVVGADMDAIIESGTDVFVPNDRKHKSGQRQPPVKDPALYEMA